MKKKYNEYTKAKMFLTRNRNLDNNDPRLLIHQQCIQRNHDHYIKYKRIENLQTKINKWRQQERSIECNNCKRCNDDRLHPNYILVFHNTSSSSVRRNVHLNMFYLQMD